MTRRIYISGPMTGLPDLNFPAFNQEAARLRAAGFQVVNPAELNPDPATTWQQCMRRDLAELLTLQQPQASSRPSAPCRPRSTALCGNRSMATGPGTQTPGCGWSSSR